MLSNLLYRSTERGTQTLKGVYVRKSDSELLSYHDVMFVHCACCLPYLDLISYLLLNLDLLKAGVPFYERLIGTGQHESKRRWT